MEIHMTTRQAELQVAGRWPDGLPRDNTELHTQFGAFVTMLVRRYNKVDRDPRDLLNQIWLRLIEADVLAKYVDALSTDMPPTMTTEQMRLFLGITDAQLRAYIWRASKGHPLTKGSDVKRYLPEPVSGTVYSQSAVWRTEDVVKLAQFADEHGCFRHQGQITVAQPKFTKKHFMGYLQRCIHHTFCNYCRTKTRKYREHLGEDLKVGNQSDNPSSWEERLEDPNNAIEDEIDLRNALARVAEAAPEVKDELIASLADGCRPDRAIKKLQGLDQETKRAILRALSGKKN